MENVEGTRFSHLCLYVTRVNISRNSGRGSYTCDKPATSVGEGYTGRGEYAPALVTFCDKHARIWASKTAKWARIAKAVR
jgi:hypothetical protein